MNLPSLLTALCVSAAVLACGASANATTAIVKNGKFENPTSTDPFTTVSAGSDIGEWKVVSGSVDLIGSYWAAHGGTGQSIDLNGNETGVIQQTLTFAHPGNYQLTFWYSGNPDGNPADKKFTVSLGDLDHQDVAYDFNNPSSTRPDLKYVEGGFTFYESGTSDILQIKSKIPGAFGAVVSDFNVVAVPEPATWALMLVGFGGLGAALRMNRRRASPITA